MIRAIISGPLFEHDDGNGNKFMSPKRPSYQAENRYSLDELQKDFPYIKSSSVIQNNIPQVCVLIPEEQYDCVKTILENDNYVVDKYKKN